MSQKPLLTGSGLASVSSPKYQISYESFLDFIEKSSDQQFANNINDYSQYIPEYILKEYESSKLLKLLDRLFTRSPACIITRETPPIRFLNNNLGEDLQAFGVKSSDSSNIANKVEIAYTIFEWNYTIGSKESIKLLESIYKSPCKREIYQSSLIRSIIDYKWDEQYIFHLIFFIFYMINLLFLTLMIFPQDAYVPVKISYYGILILSFLSFIYEFIQACVVGREYFNDIWNYIDIIRCTLCIMTGILGIIGVSHNTYPILTTFTAIFCWIRGITYFRTFKATRIFVRIILTAVKESSSFLILLLYSTLAYSTIFTLSSSVKSYSIYDAFMLAYRLDLSDFDNEEYTGVQAILFFVATIINYIIMMNLLISILGESYERVQLNLVKSDYSQMLYVIIEIEKMMIWNRNKGIKEYLHQCILSQNDDSDGKFLRIEKGIKDLNTQLQGVKATTDTKLQGVEDKLDTKLQGVEAKIEGVEAKLDGVDAKIQGVEAKMQGFEVKMSEMITKLNIILSNIEN